MTEPHGKPSDTLEIRVVTSAEDIERFNRLCQEQHCLGAARVVGDFLRQAAILDGQWAALLARGSAPYKLKDREAWIGWNNTQRAERLKRVAQNRRYRLLGPNLDGKTIAADALHCQKETARLLVEKGGDFLLQIKANQPKLLELAQQLQKVTPPLFCQ